MSVKALFEPLTIGSLTFKNRIIMSALTRSRSLPNNVPNDLNLEYYTQRTSAGMIISEGTLVCQQGSEWPWAPGIWSQKHIIAWKKITDAVHAGGSLMFCQLWHLGRVLHPDMPEQIESGEPVYGPSAVAAKGGKFRFLPGSPGYVEPTEITDPERFIQLYKQAAINAKEAGFDGVELHGANGYLVHQFLDNTANHRTDKWGGSAENRARFGLEVLKALCEVWESDRVAVKLSPCGGYNDMGMSLPDSLETFSYFIEQADKMNLAYICICRHITALDPKGRGTPHDVVESYGHLIKNSKRVWNTGFTAEEAATLISEDKADAVVFGMPWISHPDYAKRVQLGLPLDNKLDFLTFYGQTTDIEVARKGYTDYPFASYEKN